MAKRKKPTQPKQPTAQPQTPTTVQVPYLQENIGCLISTLTYELANRAEILGQQVQPNAKELIGDMVSTMNQMVVINSLIVSLLRDCYKTGFTPKNFQV